MTQGEPAKLLLLFALPMLIGSVFQMMYNMVDTIVVGRFVSVEALAAIGSHQFCNRPSCCRLAAV